jgi:predicted phosphodiesterase
MRVAALYDIHGNIHALDAVLADVEEMEPDLIVIGGDVAGGPFPRETVDRLMELPVPARFVMGNGDREVMAAFTEKDVQDHDPIQMSAHWCAQQLSQQHIDFLQGFEPLLDVLVGDSGSALFCHGSPRSDEEPITPATPAERIEPMLAAVTADIVVCGHTHMQFDRRFGETRLINAGSVGWPYERAPGAYWALVGETTLLCHTMYDLDAAATAIRGSAWPLAAEFAEENVLSVPTPEEAIAAFEPAEPTE